MAACRGIGGQMRHQQRAEWGSERQHRRKRRGGSTHLAPSHTERVTLRAVSSCLAACATTSAWVRHLLHHSSELHWSRAHAPPSLLPGCRWPREQRTPWPSSWGVVQVACVRSGRGQRIPLPVCEWGCQGRLRHQVLLPPCAPASHRGARLVATAGCQSVRCVCASGGRLSCWVR